MPYLFGGKDEPTRRHLGVLPRVGGKAEKKQVTDTRSPIGSGDDAFHKERTYLSKSLNSCVVIVCTPAEWPGTIMILASVSNEPR
jgi:hypothetical protein